MSTMHLFVMIAFLASVSWAQAVRAAIEQGENVKNKSLASIFLAMKPTLARAAWSNLNRRARMQFARMHDLVSPLHTASEESDPPRSEDLQMRRQLTWPEVQEAKNLMAQGFTWNSNHNLLKYSALFKDADPRRGCDSSLMRSQNKLHRDLAGFHHLTSRRASLMAVSIALLWRAGAANCAEPSEEAVLVAKKAFAAFESKQLPLADKLFTETINEWRRLDRGVEELTSLLVARASVRTDRMFYAEAKEDLDEAIALMAPTGESIPDGRAQYREYPDAFVQRGLAREGLRDWRGALTDYDKAVALWGGIGGDGVNPYALTYRARARTEAGDLKGALDDFRLAADLFARVDKNPNQMAAARGNEAVTLYALGRRDEAVRVAKSVVRRTQGYTDMHVMLAADAWDRGDKQTAEYEWNFACNEITTSCRKYKDMGWLTEVRRWPPVLVEMQKTFLANRIGR